jgi:hypothetical protein
MLVPEFTSLSWLMNSCVDTTQPATQSLVPLMNLVMQCTTMSAPGRSGERIMGLNVLSTIRRTPLLWAMEASSGRSLTSSSGLVIDSVNEQSASTVLLIAAIPEAMTCADSPSSIRARASDRNLFDGFQWRE